MLTKKFVLDCNGLILIFMTKFRGKSHQGEGGLAGKLKKIEKDLNKLTRGKVNIIEEGGKTLEQMLVNAEPMQITTCFRDKCLICAFPEGRGKCRERSVCYVNTCQECERRRTPYKYWGGKLL